jgi:cell division protease FtsH
MAARKPAPKKKGLNLVRLSLFWAILIIGTLTVVALMNPQQGLKEVSISSVINRANKGEISKIEIQGNDVRVTPKGEDKATERSVKEGGSSLYEQGLQQNKTDVTVVPPSTTGDTIWNLAIIIVPVLIIVGFFLFMMRSAQGQNNQAMSFGKSKAILRAMRVPSRILKRLLTS